MASSYKVDIGGLLSGGRQQLLLDQPVELEPFEGTSFAEPARVRLELHAVGRLLEITGSIDAEARSECDRCLGDVVRPIHIDVDEEIEVEESGRPDPFAENNVLTGDRLDVKDLTSQLVYSALPMSALCSEECRGLCPTCGENANTGACSCASGDE
jgi:uncharacterized protein